MIHVSNLERNLGSSVSNGQSKIGIPFVNIDFKYGR